MLICRKRKALLACLAFFAVIFLLAGCKEPPVIAPVVKLTDDGKKMAIAVGPFSRRVAYENCNPYILDLSGLNKSCSMVSIGAVDPHSFTWRYSSETDILYMTSMSTTFDKYPPDTFVEAYTEAGETKFWRRVDYYPNIYAGFSWSPNGEVLAGVSLSIPGMVPVGELAISYDRGVSVIDTDITMYFRQPVWVDDDLFYIQDRTRILEIQIKDKKPVLNRVIAEDSNRLWLCGRIESRVVYQTTGVVYCDDKVLYRANERLRRVFAEGSYAAILDGNTVLIVNGDGQTVSKRAVSEDEVLVGFSAKTNHVYLLKARRVIMQYHFENDEEAIKVFDAATVTLRE